jgi:hypothetical protein
MRKLLLRDSQCDWLFGFINWDLIFNIYYRFKFVIVVVSKISPVDTHLIHTCFGRYDARDWEHGSSVALSLPLRTAVEFSPVTLSVLEISTLADLTICRKIYSRSLRIGDNAPGWKIEFTLEFMMNTDAKHFPPREKWEAKGYRPDVFGRWIDSSGEVALPLYEGRMIGQFDCSQKGWVSGKGRSAVWRDIPFDNKTIEPQFLMGQETFVQRHGHSDCLKLAFMDITSATNARTMIATAQADLPCGNSVPVLKVKDDNGTKTLFLVASTNSLSFDFAARQRTGGLHLNWFIIQ